MQRYGDILDGKRTWQKELSRSNVRPTLPDAVAGDITAAMPYRAMVNIINFIQAVDHVVPGFAAVETLLYSPELKFYSNRVKMDTDLNTSIHRPALPWRRQRMDARPDDGLCAWACSWAENSQNRKTHKRTRLHTSQVHT